MNNLKSLIKGIENPKIFITGLSAAGKTHLARCASKEFNMAYYSYDLHWNYFRESKNSAKEFFKNLPDSFVTDAVPNSAIYNDFVEYRNENPDILVVCVFLSDIRQWIRNIINKEYYTLKYTEPAYGLIGEDSHFFRHDYYADWLYFYRYTIDENIKPTVFYDNTLNRVVSVSEFKKTREKLEQEIKTLKEKNQFLFKDYLDTLVYDKYYQDIECINFIGNSKSYETWNRIKNLVDWKDKTVIDLGCFHGYFSFKAEQAGAAKIIGLDIYPSVLETTNMLKKILTSKTEFLQWTGGEKTPPADIALVLNILHHTENEKKTVKNIDTKMAIFEVNPNQIPLIKKYFKIAKDISSHRLDRKILLGVKK